MKVMVNGEVKELVFIGKNGIDSTEDLVVDEGVVYNEELEMYESDEDTFTWWEEMIEKLENIQSMEEELTEEQSKEYFYHDFRNADFDMEADDRIEYLTNVLNK